ncbi:MAG: hypothetical protein GDA43_13765 [Hormoscilla sp. SP5CHS1]|nr:hypothetical protein [Hormoscilla sp. SP12CHS1]MBC6454128.1 hypothetical protein [Hormoscilla sp. SP5CHS1]
MNDKYLPSTNSLEGGERRLNNLSQETQPQDCLSSRSDFSGRPRTVAEIELFQALCVTEYTYPWSSLTRESQTYFTELEASTVSLTDRPEPEVAAGAQIFFAHLDRLWDAATPETMANVLEDQFANKIPAALLQGIGHQVKQLKSENGELQIANCNLHSENSELLHFQFAIRN